MKQTAVEWLENEIFRRYKFTLQQLNCGPLEEAIQQAKEIEKQQQGYSEEEVKLMLYNCCESLEEDNRRFFNTDLVVESIIKQFKKK